MKITRTDPFTGISNEKDIDVTQEQINEWKTGTLIQDAMPDMSPEDREFIMTGIINESWIQLFGDKPKDTN